VSTREIARFSPCRQLILIKKIQYETQYQSIARTYVENT